MFLSTPCTRQRQKGSCQETELSFPIMQGQGSQKTLGHAWGSPEPKPGEATQWTPWLLPRHSGWLATQDLKFEGVDLSYVSATFRLRSCGLKSLKLNHL